MLKKKKIVVAKITKIENEVFKSFEYTEAGLKDLINSLTRDKAGAWERVKKEYNLDKNKILTLNKKTREIFYEEFK